MSSSAARMKVLRERQRNGRIPLQITVDEVGLVEALIGTGFLHASDADDRRALAAAVERVLAVLIESDSVTTTIFRAC